MLLYIDSLQQIDFAVLLTYRCIVIGFQLLEVYHLEELQLQDLKTTCHETHLFFKYNFVYIQCQMDFLLQRNVIS